MAGAVIVSTFAADASVRIAYSKSRELTDLTYTAPVATSNKVARVEIAGLEADTDYWYAHVLDGALRIAPVGHFRTKPAASFKFVFGSCAYTGSTHEIWDEMLAEDPLFILHMGDLHYENIAVNTQSLFSSAFDLVFASPRQAKLYRQVPIVYMHDDHDFGPGDSDSTSAGRVASLANFRERVPYPSLALSASPDTNPVHYSFVVGRCRIIVTDLRSQRSPKGDTDNSSKTMMGASQKTWFKAELLATKAAGQYIIWATTGPWLVTSDTDTWFGYSTERTELADFFKANSLTGRMCALAGDRHASGIDSGANTNYATGGGGGIPSFMASPFDRGGGLAVGGTYDQGSYNGSGNMFGIMEVTDDGGSTIDIDWTLKLFGGATQLSYSFTATI